MLSGIDAYPNERSPRQLPEQPAVRALALPAPSWYEPCKRFVDCVAALVLLVLTAPVILLCALAIKLTSRGPAFYSQTRVGRFGQLYTIYKLRTMVHNCEKVSGPRWATRNDPRVTPVGRFLRRTHLDELPQLWNVLKGDMSLVGPRPERPEFTAHLEKAIPHYAERLLVRPGMTGLAQLHLPPDTDLNSVRQKLVYDLYYIRRAGPLLDLQILFGTLCYLLGIPVVVPSELS
ncbi:MAG TPA: sugar transferase [Gemmataceae bacterium]|nr:sugar transferase [Gemmataceae bacterium]